MRSIIQAVAIVAALAAPTVTFAQSSGTLTRAQVRSELTELEKAGYHVGDGDETTYPVELQQAEARVAREHTASTEYGGVSDGSSASGQKATPGLAPSGETYAQGNNALPGSTTLSAAANATSGYGTPGATSSDSGMATGSSRSVPPKSMNSSSTSRAVAYGVNNTLATPSTVSPAAHRN
jgi:hypothetical protein